MKSETSNGKRKIKKYNKAKELKTLYPLSFGEGLEVRLLYKIIVCFYSVKLLEQLIYQVA